MSEQVVEGGRAPGLGSEGVEGREIVRGVDESVEARVGRRRRMEVRVMRLVRRMVAVEVRGLWAVDVEVPGVNFVVVDGEARMTWEVSLVGEARK